MTLLSSVPAPTSVMCTLATPNPIRPIGSAVTLTSIVHVELGPAVDVPMTLSTVWTGPDNFTATNVSQLIWRIGSTTYDITSRAVISSFRRDQAGDYTCTASLNTSSPTNPYLIDGTTSESIQITTGETVTSIC